MAIDAFRVERKIKRLEESRAGERIELRLEPCGAERNERAARVQATLDSLSLEDRSLLILRHHEGLTFRAIGEIVDCSARTAQNRVQASARRFQTELLRSRQRERA